MVCTIAILFPPCDSLLRTSQHFIRYCCWGIGSAGAAGGERLAQHLLCPPRVCLPHCRPRVPAAMGLPWGLGRAGAGSRSLSHHPRQQQGSRGMPGAAPAPGLGCLPGDRAGLRRGPAAGPGSMEPMARQGRAVGSWDWAGCGMAGAGPAGPGLWTGQGTPQVVRTSKAPDCSPVAVAVLFHPAGLHAVPVFLLQDCDSAPSLQK